MLFPTNFLDCSRLRSSGAAWAMLAPSLGRRSVAARAPLGCAASGACRVGDFGVREVLGRFSVISCTVAASERAPDRERLLRRVASDNARSLGDVRVGARRGARQQPMQLQPLRQRPCPLRLCQSPLRRADGPAHAIHPITSRRMAPPTSWHSSTGPLCRAVEHRSHDAQVAHPSHLPKARSTTGRAGARKGTGPPRIVMRRASPNRRKTRCNAESRVLAEPASCATQRSREQSTVECAIRASLMIQLPLPEDPPCGVFRPREAAEYPTTRRIRARGRAARGAWREAR